MQPGISAWDNLIGPSNNTHCHQYADQELIVHSAKEFPQKVITAPTEYYV
jgi:hypothetical protein